MKAAREKIGLDQAEVARRLNVKVHVISNVEKYRAPVRCDLALRFCRELFINEEWLATGRFDSLHAELAKVGVSELHAWEPILLRSCLNLLYNPVFSSVPPRSLFSEAFSKYLKPVAEKLSEKDVWLMPPTPFTEYDRPEYRSEFLQLLIGNWTKLMKFRATEKGLDDSLLKMIEWDFVDNLTLACMLVFYRSFETSTPFQDDPQFDFLRKIVKDDTTPIGLLASIERVSVSDEGTLSFTDDTETE